MREPLRTMDDTVGPYFPPLFASQGKLDLYRPMNGLNVGPLGEPIILKVRLFDINSQLASSTLLEVWQPNANGHLRVPGSESALADDPFFQGYGRVYSPTGEFLIRTIMPGPSRVDSTVRAPWITLTIFSDGIARIVTQVFFEGHPTNDSDPVFASVPPGLRQRLIARREPNDGHEAQFTTEIRMRGDDETPFFDDQPN